jgi:hypothetical protein
VPATEPLATVVVSLRSGVDVKGVLRDAASDALVLSAASVAGEQGGRTVWQKMPGEVVIPMGNIDYWQRSLPPEILAELMEEG